MVWQAFAHRVSPTPSERLTADLVCRQCCRPLVLCRQLCDGKVGHHKSRKGDP